MKFLAFMVVMLGTATLILYSGFTLPTEVALSILVLAIASDSLTTYLCLRAKGREGNPVMAFLFRRLGVTVISSVCPSPISSYSDSYLL